jgi:hypothetical protein
MYIKYEKWAKKIFYYNSKKGGGLWEGLTTEVWVYKQGPNGLGIGSLCP